MHWSVFTTGFVLSAALIVAIGAQNAFVLRQGLRREHVAAVVVFCAAADLALMAAGVAGLAGTLEASRPLVDGLAVGGALFLLWYGGRALSRALRPGALHSASGGAPMSLSAAMAQVAGFTLLNPHVYLDTVLLVGSVGAQQPAELRSWFVGGAAVASTAWFSGLGYGARLLAPLFARPTAWRVLDTLVGLTMVGLSVLLIRQVLLR